MLLSLEDANLFFKLHGSLMQFANERLKVVSTEPTPCDFRDLSPEDRRNVVTEFLGRPDLIESFITEKPAALSGEENEIVSSWRHLVAGRFVVLRQLKKHMIFLSTQAPSVAYGVLALTEPLDLVIGRKLPAVVETVLLPFRDKIIYDGLLGQFNVTFGAVPRGALRTATARPRNMTAS